MDKISGRDVLWVVYLYFLATYVRTGSDWTLASVVLITIIFFFYALDNRKKG